MVALRVRLVENGDDAASGRVYFFGNLDGTVNAKPTAYRAHDHIFRSNIDSVVLNSLQGIPGRRGVYHQMGLLRSDSGGYGDNNLWPLAVSG
jgi:hypothetical protein